MDRMGWEDSISKAILIEHVHHGKLTAERVTAMFKVHLSKLIGVSLDQNRYTAVPQGGNGAVFIPKVRQAEDHAVILALVFF